MNEKQRDFFKRVRQLAMKAGANIATEEEKLELYKYMGHPVNAGNLDLGLYYTGICAGMNIALTQ